MFDSNVSIVRNAIRCNHCDAIVVSEHRHDMQSCSCGKVSVDGGKQYLRRLFQERSDYTELSQVRNSAGQISFAAGAIDNAGGGGVPLNEVAN